MGLCNNRHVSDSCVTIWMLVSSRSSVGNFQTWGKAAAGAFLEMRESVHLCHLTHALPVKSREVERKRERERERAVTESVV